jgi:glucose-6-phosphate 1-dehydrogenase
MPTAPPCAFVIFGASGDLARRKLIPGIYELARDGLLSEKTFIMGFARTDQTDEQFRAICRESVQKHARTGFDESVWAKIEPRLYYASADYGSMDDHARVRARVDQLDATFGTQGNRLFYLSTPPAAFEPVISCLGAREPQEKHPERTSASWHRIITEKPFGQDLASAQRLNHLLHQYFAEEQVFRIDHFLGKETVQNLMVMRFANSIFEPIWNYKYIDHVQITVSETLGVGTRGGYYDRSGALRDMVQNHMLQLLSLVAMEPPASLEANSIRDEKVKVFRSMRAIRPERVRHVVVRGQYAAGEFDGQQTQGYLGEAGVRPKSPTETFVALKLYLDNWRWSGMPFYLRTGRFMPEKLSEVVVRFRTPPLALFQKQFESPVYNNDLVIRVQPDEGISWRLNGKVPGGQMNIKQVSLNFLYSTAFHVEPPEAYERLLHDAMLGDQTLFIRGDEVEAAWALIDPIEQGWRESDDSPKEYAPGTWGPQAAMDLIEHDGRRWLHAGDGVPDPIIACSL